MSNVPEHSGSDCPCCGSQGSLSYFQSGSASNKPVASCAVCQAEFGSSAQPDSTAA